MWDNKCIQNFKERRNLGPSSFQNYLLRYNYVCISCPAYNYMFNILSRIRASYKMGFGLGDWIYCTVYIHIFQDYRKYSAIVILHIFQLTVAHALGFSVFTSRILATDLSQSHCNVKSHVKSSCHSGIPFLPFLQFPIPKTRLDYSRLLFYTPTTVPLLLLKVKVTLRLAVYRQSVCLGVKPLETHDQTFFSPELLR
jgi:hypothetical protein